MGITQEEINIQTENLFNSILKEENYNEFLKEKKYSFRIYFN